MSVSWVAGTSSTYVTTGTSVSRALPTVQDDDCVLAFCVSQPTQTTPTGWMLIASVTCESTTYGYLWTLACYAKESVSSGDSGSTLTVNYSTSGAAGLTIAAARASVDQVLIGLVGTANDDETSASYHTPEPVTAVGDGELAILAGTTLLAYTSPTTTTLTQPYGTTLWSGATAVNNRLAGAYQARDTGESTTGSFVSNLTSTPGNAWASISIRLFDGTIGGWASDDVGPLAGPPEARALAVAPVYGYASDTGLPQEGSALAVGATAGGWATAESPLVQQVAVFASGNAALASAPSPLDTASAIGVSDFSAVMANLPAIWICDLTGGAEDLRVPISSFQCTLQTAREQYLQVVVPAAGDYASEINARATAGGEIVVSRVGTLADGTTVTHEIARGPIEQVRLNRGGTNYSATLSGYTATDEADWASGVTVTLDGVRTLTSGDYLSARAAPGWILRPGMTVDAAGTSFVAGYVSYYVTTSDAFMDVGEA